MSLPEPLLMTFHYRAEVVERLTRHGVRVTSRTNPQLVRDYLNDLYRYELRALRDRMLSGEFPKRELTPRVIELRKRYTLLSIPLRDWIG